MKLGQSGGAGGPSLECRRAVAWAAATWAGQRRVWGRGRGRKQYRTRAAAAPVRRVAPSAAATAASHGAQPLHVQTGTSCRRGSGQQPGSFCRARSCSVGPWIVGVALARTLAWAARRPRSREGEGAAL
eukprot:scaffold324447_cov61-Tisochrysis_lutea.AAC.6